MTTTKTVSAHGYLIQPEWRTRSDSEWMTDQAHSTRWARTKTALYNVAMIVSLCLFLAAIAVVAIETKNMIVWAS